MKLSRRFFIVVLFAVTMPLIACVAQNTKSKQYEQIMQHLKESTTQDNYEQIAGAIGSSPKLKQEMSMLAASGKFTGFIVANRNNVTSGKVTIYGGFIDGTKIVFTNEFLQILRKSRYFDVVYEDDISPDNTIFALAHLAHHLQVPIEPQQYTSPSSYNQANLKDEAVAFIEAWNTMLDVAKTRTGDKQLSPRQVGQLFVNTRYKFAFKGLEHWDKDSSIPADVANIQHIVSTLGHSAIADLE